MYVILRNILQIPRRSKELSPRREAETCCSQHHGDGCGGAQELPEKRVVRPPDPPDGLHLLPDPVVDLAARLKTVLTRMACHQRHGSEKESPCRYAGCTDKAQKERNQAAYLKGCIMGKREKNERRGVRRQFDKREARKQADRMENDGSDQGGDFNIWYGPRKKRRGAEKASTRCDPDLDAGATRGSEAGAREFCIFFARGACARGYSCHKLHFVPAPEDDAGEDNTHDCFGRERSGADDDDRDGVGCFLKENRTLWLGGVPVIDEASSRERVRHNFEAWGRISSIRLVKNKSCAFVQYTYRANAEFAKEAMSNQTLLSREQAASFRGQKRGKIPGPRRPPSSVAGGGSGGRGGGASGEVGEEGPVLHVRWAAEDPNPRAVLRAREVHAQTLLAAQVATGALPRDVTGRLPGADRVLLRKMGMNPNDPAQVDVDFQNTQRQYLALQEHSAQDQYPNTDHQYPNTDHQYPINSTDHQYPKTDGQYPSAGLQYPGSGGQQYPSTDHQYPNTGNQYPNTDHQYPGSGHQYPNTDHQYPNAGDQYPSTDHQYPSAGHQYPSTGTQYPSTDHQYPSTDHQYPSTCNHQYPSNDQGYSSGNTVAAAAGAGPPARSSPPINSSSCSSQNINAGGDRNYTNNAGASDGGNTVNEDSDTTTNLAAPSSSTNNTLVRQRHASREIRESGNGFLGNGGVLHAVGQGFHRNAGGLPCVGKGGTPPLGRENGESGSVAPREAAAVAVGEAGAGGALSLLGGYGSDDSE
eukprot:jgi/Undpi1/3285/HiC_scaffold_15.g06659.m1